MPCASLSLLQASKYQLHAAGTEAVKTNSGTTRPEAYRRRTINSLDSELSQDPSWGQGCPSRTHSLTRQPSLHSPIFLYCSFRTLSWSPLLFDKPAQISRGQCPQPAFWSCLVGRAQGQAPQLSGLQLRTTAGPEDVAGSISQMCKQRLGRSDRQPQPPCFPLHAIPMGLPWSVV